jgi:hypothetical protein
MGLERMLRRYQGFDPLTGTFGVRRSLTQYATALGTVTPSLLSHIYAGRKRPGLEVVRGLSLLIANHPVLWRELMDALNGDMDRKEAA